MWIAGEAPIFTILFTCVFLKLRPKRAPHKKQQGWGNRKAGGFFYSLTAPVL